MDRVKRAIYIGSDKAYLSEVESTFIPKSELFYYIESIDSPQEIISAIVEVIPNIIFLDVCELVKNEDDSRRFLYLMRMLKSSFSIGSCLYAAIFSSKEQRREYSYLFSCGFNFGVIKSDELSAYNDIGYIIGSPNFVFTPYATAKFHQLKYSPALQLDVTSISEDHLHISSDVELDEWENEIIFKLFHDYKVTYYDQIRKEGLCHISDAMYEYALALPYVGPNEEVSEDSLFPEMMNTWLDLNRKRMAVLRCSVFIIASDINFSILTYNLYEKHHLDAYYFRMIDLEENPITDILPDIIIIDMGQIEESGISLQDIIKSVESVEAYHPMIITFGNMSTSEATQKAFSYFNILAVGQKITAKMIDQLIEVFYRSEKHGLCEKVVRFFVNDPRKIGHTKLEVEITSLSEQFVTFTSKIDIPMFTNIMFDQPTELMALIVPPFKELEVFPRRKHYLAIFHCSTHEDKQLLRRFVNQCIFSPPDEFKYVKLELEKEEGYFVKMETTEKINEEKKSESVSRKFENNRLIVKGKSKL